MNARFVNIRCIFVAGALLLLSGCSSIQPWVKPYERENIADPIMAFDRNAVDSKFMGHGFGNREAAIGAEGGAGGGCGCN